MYTGAYSGGSAGGQGARPPRNFIGPFGRPLTFLERYIILNIFCIANKEVTSLIFLGCQRVPCEIFSLRPLQWWRQEFSDGGLTLPTRGIKYNLQGAINAKNVRKNRVSPSDGGLGCSNEGAIAP